MLNAYDMGADIVKIFPIKPSDIDYLKLILSPISHIPFITTGGVTPKTIPSFLQLGATALAAGASIVNRQIAEEGNFELVRKNAKAHIDAIKKYLQNSM